MSGRYYVPAIIMRWNIPGATGILRFRCEQASNEITINNHYLQICRTPVNGAPVPGHRRMGLAWNVVTSPGEPGPFREAVGAMQAAAVRSEIELSPIRPPQRLAPYSYALGAEVKPPEPGAAERAEGSDT
jgi:hypothetical protein